MKNLNKRLIQSARKTYRFFSRKGPGESRIIIMPYKGFTNGHQFFLKGRVLEDKNIRVQIHDSKWRNLINSFKRFESDELPNAEVAIHLNGQTFQTVSDEEGYFSFFVELEPALKPNDHFWGETPIELLRVPGIKTKKYVAPANFLHPSSQADFGVISDMDDTVLRTHVNSTMGLRMLYATLMSNAHQRRPMEGIVKLYQALANGRHEQAHNPFFYVSNSPWNIYDLLTHFIDLQQLPKGPILLRDYGLSPANFSSAFHEHKEESMDTILGTFPKLPFILMGDTGSKDVDHYLNIARKYPGRILAIYIRSLKETPNARRVRELVENTRHVDIRLIKNTGEIWQDVRKKGFVS